MHAARPAFISQFEELTKDPTLGLPKHIEEHELKSVIVWERFAAGLALEALALVSYYYSYLRWAVLLAIAGGITLYFDTTNEEVRNMDFLGQSVRIDNATKKIFHGLLYYARAKQIAGIDALHGIDLSDQDDPEAFAQLALKDFNGLYNGETSYTGLLEAIEIDVSSMQNHADTQIYRELLPTAKTFLALDPKKASKAPQQLKDDLPKIQTAAFIFIHGSQESPEGYLKISVDEESKIVAEPWIQINIKEADQFP